MRVTLPKNLHVFGHLPGDVADLDLSTIESLERYHGMRFPERSYPEERNESALENPKHEPVRVPVELYGKRVKIRLPQNVHIAGYAPGSEAEVPLVQLEAWSRNNVLPGLEPEIRRAIAEATAGAAPALEPDNTDTEQQKEAAASEPERKPEQPQSAARTNRAGGDVPPPSHRHHRG